MSHSKFFRVEFFMGLQFSNLRGAFSFGGFSLFVLRMEDVETAEQRTSFCSDAVGGPL